MCVEVKENRKQNRGQSKIENKTEDKAKSKTNQENKQNLYKLHSQPINTYFCPACCCDGDGDQKTPHAFCHETCHGTYHVFYHDSCDGTYHVVCYETCRADCYEMAWYPGCESDAERYDKVYHSDYQKYFDGDAQDFEIYVLGCKIDPFATV